MRELRFICFTIAILCLTGFLIVSCTFTGPQSHLPDAKAERNPFNPPTLVTNSYPTPPLPGARVSAVKSTVVTAVIIRRSHPLPLAWDAVQGASGYWLYVSTGNQQWTYRVDVGTNTTVNLTNYSAPMEFQVTAYNSSRMEGPASAEAYYGVKSNGWPMAGNFVFIADPSSVYRLSNSPLIKTNWAPWTTISNRSGLVSLPLPGPMVNLKMTAER